MLGGACIQRTDNAGGGKTVFLLCSSTVLADATTGSLPYTCSMQDVRLDPSQAYHHVTSLSAN